MPAPNPSSTRQEIERQQRRVQSLRVAAFSQTDPAANADLLQKLLAEEARLQKLEQEAASHSPTAPEPSPAAAPRGRFLGPKTTGLQVEPKLNMNPLPTGIYHLLDPETDPLLTVVVRNESRDVRRVAVKAFLEGISAQAVRTVEIEPRSQPITLKLLPTIFPEHARRITEVQRATLHVVAEDLDGKPESHDTFSVLCLARTSSFNSVRRPDTALPVDLTHYYAAWVTPYNEKVQERIRDAARLLESRMIWGYQQDPDSVPLQVEALYNSLKKAGIAYINSVIDYGSGRSQSTQRTRLPRESLKLQAANCIDGTVLMASLLEGASLNAAIVLVPGHAFVGWETWEGSDEWRFLETTMIGHASFAEACKSAQDLYDRYRKENLGWPKLRKLNELRERGIYPME